MKKISLDQYIIYCAVVITLIFTPMNFDALIIPKISVLFVLGMYLIPKIYVKAGEIKQNRKILALFVILFLFICQLTLVMFFSPAPFEQEFFGRTGRGLGLTTYLSIAILLLAMAVYSHSSTTKHLIVGLSISGIFSSLYSLSQRFNLDPIEWNSRTNGIIGTLGNPNFQSSFIAMVFVPLLIYSIKHKFKLIIAPISLLIFTSTIYFTQSTQGYVATAATVLLLLLLFTWYKNRKIFYITAVSGTLIGVVTVFGMVNKGPLSTYLYKPSVASRGDFWRAALNMANDNPIFGVGLDSYSDNFLIYRDRAQIEMSDNAHNYFLEFLATGGYPLAMIYISLTLLTILSIYSIQRKIGKFDFELSSLYSAWFVFQLQSFISPSNISLIVWNALISGYLIGYDLKKIENKNGSSASGKKLLIIPNLASKTLLVLGLIIMFPLYNSDKNIKSGFNKSDLSLVMKSLTAYPESSIRYNVFTQEIIKLNLLPQALELSRAAVRFNPNAVSAWALIFVNPQAPLEERLKAKSEILRLDPLNQEIFKYELK